MIAPSHPKRSRPTSSTSKKTTTIAATTPRSSAGKRASYRGGKVKVNFTLRKDGADALNYAVQGDWYDSKGRLTASPKASGSHITFHSDATWKSSAWLAKLLMKNMLQNTITKDMKEHLRLLDEDWQKTP